MIQTTEVPRDELVNRLRAIAAERASDRVFVRADGAVPYAGVVQVMGALKAALDPGNILNPGKIIAAKV